MEPRITLITLGVNDLDVATEFYRDGLKLPMHDFPGDISFFKTSSTWLTLYPRDALAEDIGISPDGKGFSCFTLAHNVKTRDEVDAVLEQAQSSGATIIKPAEDKEWGGYSGYFSDPDGYYWEVAWNPHFWID